MEADSTTYDSSLRDRSNNERSPFTFPVNANNLQLYKELTYHSGEKIIEMEIVDRLKNFGLLCNNMCPNETPHCRLVCRRARVVDKVQWVCEACNTKLAVRAGSFFSNIFGCSLLKSLQIILAWSEDIDVTSAAEIFDVKPKTAIVIYDRLDELTLRQQRDIKLGGKDVVVFVEVYPTCMTQLSPDTTDQPHVHRVLMLADTKSYPTHYWLQVIGDHEILQTKVEEVLSKVVLPESLVITGMNIPPVNMTTTTIEHILRCNVEMQNFLSTSSRLWSQALIVLQASRDLCEGEATPACELAVQRYLHNALYRLQRSDSYYRHILELIASDTPETNI